MGDFIREVYLLPYLEDRLEFENWIGGYRAMISSWNSIHKDVYLSLSASYTVGVGREWYKGAYVGINEDVVFYNVQ